MSDEKSVITLFNKFQSAKKLNTYTHLHVGKHINKYAKFESGPISAPLQKKN